MIPFCVRECKTKAALEAVPERSLRLELGALAAAGYPVIASTRAAIVVVAEGVQVIVHAYGKLTFKECTDAVLAERLARAIYAAAAPAAPRGGKG